MAYSKNATVVRAPPFDCNAQTSELWQNC